MDRPLLAIVPARGGSKGVPGKNMRSLGDRPLLAHTVEALSEASVARRLVISSDHEAVMRWAEVHGHETLRRPPELSGDEATISDMAVHVTERLAWEGDVGVFQPTSPFRRPGSIRAAVQAFHEADVDSLASVVREPHLFWADEDDDLEAARPLFASRVNRQYARHRVLRETGAIQLVRAAALLRGRQMVTERHRLFETPLDESLDIDTQEDLIAARRRLQRGTVVFRVRANARVGSGHVYHCLQLADELVDQRLRFLLVDCDPFVAAMIEEHGYEQRAETDLSADLAALAGCGANLIVNDVLDTTEREVLTQRTAGYRVVNVEDMGAGAHLADWVVNALYTSQKSDGLRVSSGAAYAPLRSEFHGLPPKRVRESARRVLITFGGTDPGRLGPRCARVLDARLDVDIRVVVGPGAPAGDFPQGVTVMDHVRSMAAEMIAADVVLTSAGRTVYEAAATGTPVVVLAQGARDATHAHLGFDSGVIFLGIAPLVDDEHVVGVLSRLLADHALRSELGSRLRSSVDEHGAARIGHRIRGMLRGIDVY